MSELRLVFLLVAALGAMVALGSLPPETIITAGAALIALGMLTGIPASFVYHRALRAELSASGPLPRRWWWNPVPHHARLDGAGAARVRVWFRVGAAMAGVAVLGCGMVLVSVLRLR